MSRGNEHPPNGVQLSTFEGTNPTGEWKLYVYDDTQQPDTGDRNGAGVFDSGWALEITGTGRR